MATAANAITSTANIAAYPGYNSAWTTGQQEAAIDRVSKFIENYCNCNFINTTYTAEKYDGSGDRDLLLDHFPIVSVTSLTDTPTGGTATTVSTSDLLIYSQEGRLTVKTSSTYGGFTDDEQNISVTYVAGYGASIANLPPDIVEAATRMAVMWLTETSGIKAEKIGDYSITYNDNAESLPSDLRAILDLYRRPAFDTI